MGLNSSLWAVALAGLGFYSYDTGRSLFMMYNNAPSRLPSINTFDSHSIRFGDRIRSCEDVVVLEEQGLAILACDAGRERWNTVMGIFLPGTPSSGGLYAYDYKNPATPDSQALKAFKLVNFDTPADFHTVGMAFDEETATLLVSNHANLGSKIESFKLDINKLTATHTGSIQHPLLHGPNSITFISSHELYVTNDHHFTQRQSKILAMLETYSALPLGSVVYVRLGDDGKIQEIRVVARVPFANGVELLNATTAAVASTNQAYVNIYDVQDDKSLKRRSRIRVPFMPDNLSVSDGKLLIAGHPHVPSIDKYANTRYICNDPVELGKADDETKDYCKIGNAASWASEWSESGGLRHLYVGVDVSSSTTAARDAKRGVGIITGLYQKGVFTWRE